MHRWLKTSWGWWICAWPVCRWRRRLQRLDGKLSETWSYSLRFGPWAEGPEPACAAKEQDGALE